MDPVAGGAEPLDVARARVAAQARALSSRLAIEDLDADELREVAATLSVLVAGSGGGPRRRTRFARSAVAGGESANAHDLHPFNLGQSGVFPPLDMALSGRRIVARTRFGPAWEGPPGLVHGGFLATAFDMASSTLAASLAGPSVTRTLQVRYVRPTFLEAELRYEVEAGPVLGRLMDLEGRLYADDVLTLRGTAQFASLSAERFSDRSPG